MPSRANIEVIRLGDLSPVEIAKIAVSNNLETSIQKTALNDQRFVAVNRLLINGLVRNCQSQIVGAESRGWKYHLPDGETVCSSTIVQRNTEPSEGRAALFLRVRR